MAANLDYKADGTASVLSVKEDMWHREGTVLANAPTRAEAMEIAGLDFEVDLRPLTTTREVSEGDTIEFEVPSHRAVVRNDRSVSLGVVGPSYHALQNEDAFATLDPILDAGIATIETAGALREGRDVWMQVGLTLTLPGVFYTGEVKPYLLISNNHAGERKAQVQHTARRVVCENTLNFAHAAAAEGIDRAIKVGHRRHVKVNTVKAVADMVATLTKNFTLIAGQYEALRNRFLTEVQFDRYVLDVLAPMPAKPENVASKGNIAVAAWERASDRALAKRTRLVELWDNGDGHTGDHSAWEAYNAATQSIDHDGDLWKVNDDASRLASLWQGQLGKAKQAVMDSLYSFSV
jgi:phage/plasmid-like protein (TIGR03299 family)